MFFIFRLMYLMNMTYWRFCQVHETSISSNSLVFGATQRQTLTKTTVCQWRSPVSRYKGGSTQYTGWIHDACVDCAFPIRNINAKGYSRVNLHWGWVCGMPDFTPVSSQDVFHNYERENHTGAFFKCVLWAFMRVCSRSKMR